MKNELENLKKEYLKLFRADLQQKDLEDFQRHQKKIEALGDKLLKMESSYKGEFDLYF